MMTKMHFGLSCYLKFLLILMVVLLFGFTSYGQNKMVIYQLLPRYFGNTKTTNIPYGTIDQNGIGKFNDITDSALKGLKELHVSYVWYTGVLAHASLTDYSQFGIKPDDADVVKGRAGSPYAIRDYYDVDPDLAVDVPQRLAEFDALIKRTHQQGLKVLIDFVPNHVARSYRSNVRPNGVVDFGVNDDKTVTFSTTNDFYYIPNQSLKVPENSNEPDSPLKILSDGKFEEYPAKATGNNIFSASPSVNDWYETVKLNYGVEYVNGKEVAHFNPIPPVWLKMRDILIYWTNRGVDGFRCDVAEMVPVEFWEWVIPQVKKVNPNLIFIAEAYNREVYSLYLTKGKFDFLYDKVGLYDGLKRLIRNEEGANVEEITKVWKEENAGFDGQMLRFLENHDEERIASKSFAGKAELAFPAMVVASTLGRGPIMIYFGQEVGEPAGVSEGYIGDDIHNSRTTIFEYWGVPNHQNWMNNGRFDGGKLTHNQKEIRIFYQKLLGVATENEAIKEGEIVELTTPNLKENAYAFIRYTSKQRLLIIANFDRTKTLVSDFLIPEKIRKLKEISIAKDLLSNTVVTSTVSDKITVKVLPSSAQIIQF